MYGIIPRNARREREPKENLNFKIANHGLKTMHRVIGMLSIDDNDETGSISLWQYSHRTQYLKKRTHL